MQSWFQMLILLWSTVLLPSCISCIFAIQQALGVMIQDFNRDAAGQISDPKIQGKAFQIAGGHIL